jgi:hypothetical protein
MIYFGGGVSKLAQLQFSFFFLKKKNKVPLYPYSMFRCMLRKQVHFVKGSSATIIAEILGLFSNSLL